MSFLLDGNPTQEELVSAVNYLLANLVPSNSTNQTTGEITDSSGTIIGYLYKYIHIKYADSFDGSVGFSNTPTNKQYYGIRNTDDPLESTNPSDYVWVKVTFGFGTTRFLWYLTTGGRQIQFYISATQPNPGWAQDSGSAIDLDKITAATSSPANFIVNRITNDSSAPTNAEVVAAIGRDPISGDLCTVVYNSGISSLLYKYTTGWAAYIAYISTDQIIAGTITAGDINASTIFTNGLKVGSNPAISGTTMTGSGGYIYNNGEFAFGNASSNIVFNGTSAYINGFSAANLLTYIPGTSYPITPGANSFTITSSENNFLNFDPTKPIIISTTVDIIVWASTYLNPSAPQGMKAYISPEYCYSTNNGASYSSWGNVCYFWIQGLSDNSYSVTGSDRNFAVSGANVTQITVPSNTTNIKFRMVAQLDARLNRDWTGTGVWAVNIPPSLPGTAFINLDLSSFNMLALQIKV